MTTFVVTTSADVANGDVSENDLSLREAIELANANPGADRITFADGIDYVALTDKLPTISDGLRLVGGGDVVLDANADGDFDAEDTAEERNRRGLDIQGEDIEVTIDGLTITGGSISDGTGGGGIRSGADSHLKIVDSLIVRNWVGGRLPLGTGSGGGILAGGDCEILRTRIHENCAGDEGGGIAVGGDCRIERSRITATWTAISGSMTAEASLQKAICLRNTHRCEKDAIREGLRSGGGIHARGDVRMIDAKSVQ